MAAAIPEPAAGEIRELVEDVQGAVDARAPEPRSAVRWVRLDGLHVTLRFLGPTDEERVGAVGDAVARAVAGQGTIDVTVSGAGAFPSAARPRTLWLGIPAGATELAGLATRIGAELEPLGWPVDDRPFRAHLTLARADGRREGPLVAALLAERAAELRVGFTVDSVVLFESVTGGGPARYVPRRAVALEG